MQFVAASGVDTAVQIIDECCDDRSEQHSGEYIGGVVYAEIETCGRKGDAPCCHKGRKDTVTHQQAEKNCHDKGIGCMGGEETVAFRSVMVRCHDKSLQHVGFQGTRPGNERLDETEVDTVDDCQA